MPLPVVLDPIGHWQHAAHHYAIGQDALSRVRELHTPLSATIRIFVGSETRNTLAEYLRVELRGIAITGPPGVAVP